VNWWFETDSEYAEELRWVDQFLTERVEPIDHLVAQPYDVNDPRRRELIPPLQDEVRRHGFWACHLGPELGGAGYGQLRLALLNELLGRSRSAPIVFGCQAPDSGNAEILAHFGTDALKRTYLEPLLAGRIMSAYAMTEPQGGADPGVFTTTAVLDGDEWVITGEKWFVSSARWASFFIVLAVTEPDEPTVRRMSTFVVPAGTVGVEILRNVAVYGHDASGDGAHSYVRFDDVRVPADHLLGDRGGGFVVAQTRLGGGRVHHAMRTVGIVRKALDMLCERALSRYTQGELLANKQLVQEMIADSWIELEQFRLLVLQTAWKIDRYQDYLKVRADISAVKATMPTVLHNVAARALQLHGSLGVSDEMPFGSMIMDAFSMGLADGPTEVHKTTLARQVLRGRTPSPGLFPTGHLPAARAAALAQLGEIGA
jgi:acyl-CoA dehydrogenase